MVIDNMNKIYPQLFSAEKRVVDYIRKHSKEVVGLSVSEVAEASGTSDATVIRLCKRLGYSGFYQLKINLAREEGSRQIVGNFEGKDSPETVQGVMKTIIEHLSQVGDTVNTKDILECAKAIRTCATVHVVAAGNTIPVAIDFAFRLGRLGIKAYAAIAPEYYLSNINLGTSNDLIIGISHTGTSVSVIQAMELGKQKGMKAIAITEKQRSEVGDMADYKISTGIESDLFMNYGPRSHTYMLAVLDILMYFVVNLDKTTRDIDELEFILAEYKI